MESILAQRRCHAKVVGHHMYEGTSWAFAQANSLMNSTASSLHLPPVSIATTTNRHLPELISSGYVVSLSVVRILLGPSDSVSESTVEQVVACSHAQASSGRRLAESMVVAKVCQGGGPRVATNVMVRDMDLAVPNPGDSRRIEVLADGLAFFGGVRLAIDTTLVPPLHANGTARPGAAQNNGVALRVARRRKESGYPELSEHNNRCRWVVLAAEVGGRCSDETRTFIRSLARFKARSAPPLLRGWWSLLSCAAARAFACSLVDLRVPGGPDGNLPLACEVEGEQRHAGLA